jgi:prepilin-type N-terminal cleavage/methylation domain-containing protein
VAAVKRQHGATLIELLVALALLGTVAVLSAQLVIQATKLMNTVARASRNPDLMIAAEWIRRDLYGAVAVIGTNLGWTDGPLVAMTQSGGWIALAPIDGELVRTDAPPASLPDNRVILRGVVGWRWRVIDGATAVIELEAFANPDAHENLTGAADYRLDRQTVRLTLALRGRPGGRAW